MGGVNVESTGGGRRALDSELNMIPMIDLLMVTISFLLITAVWSQAGRMDASTQVPRAADPNDPVDVLPAVKSLHVEVEAERFVLSWRLGHETVDRSEVPRQGAGYGALAARIGDQWRTAGSHREAGDRVHDRAVIHVPDSVPYAELVGVMDAIKATRRPGTSKEPAFDVTLAI